MAEFHGKPGEEVLLDIEDALPGYAQRQEIGTNAPIFVHLPIPEDILQNIDIKDPSQLEEIIRIGIKQMKIEKALHSYKKGQISLAKAAELAIISLSEMMMQASARGLNPLYDKRMVEEETQ